MRELKESSVGQIDYPIQFENGYSSAAGAVQCTRETSPTGRRLSGDFPGRTESGLSLSHDEDVELTWNRTVRFGVLLCPIYFDRPWERNCAGRLQGATPPTNYTVPIPGEETNEVHASNSPRPPFPPPNRS